MWGCNATKKLLNLDSEPLEETSVGCSALPGWIGNLCSPGQNPGSEQMHFLCVRAAGEACVLQEGQLHGVMVWPRGLASSWPYPCSWAESPSCLVCSLLQEVAAATVLSKEHLGTYPREEQCVPECQSSRYCSSLGKEGHGRQYVLLPRYQQLTSAHRTQQLCKGLNELYSKTFLKSSLERFASSWHDQITEVPVATRRDLK